MKKLVLILVFIIIMALFVSFNYLLWDRESREKELKALEYTNASNNANIISQSREIKNLEDENSKLRSDITELENLQQQMLQGKNQLVDEKSQITNTLSQKNKLVNFLKQNIDIKILEKPVKDWVKAVNSGDYSTAYALEHNELNEAEEEVSLADYTSTFKSSITGMKLESIMLDITGENRKGDIILAVTLQVTLNKSVGTIISRFEEGQNKMLFQVDYDSVGKRFVIMSITKRR